MKLRMRPFAVIAKWICKGNSIFLARCAIAFACIIPAMNVAVAAEEGGSLSLLAVSPGLIIWTFIIFGLVFLILQKFAWRPIAASLDARAKKIHDNINEAERLRQEATEKLSLYEQKLSQAKTEADQLLEQKIQEAEQSQKAIISQTRRETAEMVENSKRQIREAQEKAQAEIQKSVIHISVEIAKKILAREINSTDHARLFEQGVDQLKGSNLPD